MQFVKIGSLLNVFKCEKNLDLTLKIEVVYSKTKLYGLMDNKNNINYEKQTVIQ